MVELNEKQLMEIDGGRGQHEVSIKIWTPFVRVSYKFSGNNSRKKPSRARGGRGYTLGITSRNRRRHR